MTCPKYDLIWWISHSGHPISVKAILTYGSFTQSHPQTRYPPEQTPTPGRRPPRQPLQRTVRILLECILVFNVNIQDHLHWGKAQIPFDFCRNSVNSTWNLLTSWKRCRFHILFRSVYINPKLALRCFCTAGVEWTFKFVVSEVFLFSLLTLAATVFSL